MFSKLFGKKDTTKAPKAPEIMGLYLGGSFQIDPLKLKLIEPSLIINAPASSHIIQAVGEVDLDSGGKILRFYTDDDAFLQVVLDGGMTENHITDVKLWYFYETKTVGSDAQWQDLLKNDISQAQYSLEGHTYQRVWDAVGDVSPAVAMTEKTYEEDGDVSETDQFVMLYERELDNSDIEALLVSGEEKLVGQNLDRCLVISSGINIAQADISING
ncbi:YjfK family protein [Paraglaciecola chathamensis]|uniref:YjfK family protein n=1 Tax=Paraglaciecola chathamensis TaxID=368405 RepID=UPI0026FE0337|nr:YjfK family protein [Paraglaciecola chathamensis]MDO6558314.1 YjfK family protein [Paraglaciecola chathamensis]